MSLEELFKDGATPEILDLVRVRLTGDENLFSRHQLRTGLTKARARLVLILAAKAARESGLSLYFNADEKRLMGKNFSL